MRQTALFFLDASIVLVLFSPGFAEEESAADVLRRFVDRIDADAPVSGVFEVSSVFDPEAYATIVGGMRSDAEARGFGYVPQPESASSLCRWAWDGQREMYDNGEGTADVESFLRTDEALLEAVVPLNYNLDRAKYPSTIRPASFYFVVGKVPWRSLALVAPPAFDQHNPGGDAVPADAAVLRLVTSALQIRLFVRNVDSRSAGHDVFAEDQLIQRVRIARFGESEDGRRFPTDAILQTYRPRGDKLFNTYRLKAVNVDFPTTPEAVEESFVLMIPKGAEVHDIVLQKEFLVDNDVDARELLQGGIADPWHPMNASSGIVYEDIDGRARTPNSKGNVLFWVNAAAVVVIGIVLLARVALRRRPFRGK